MVSQTLLHIFLLALIATFCLKLIIVPDVHRKVQDVWSTPRLILTCSALMASDSYKYSDTKVKSRAVVNLTRLRNPRGQKTISSIIFHLFERLEPSQGSM